MRWFQSVYRQSRPLHSAFRMIGDPPAGGAASLFAMPPPILRSWRIRKSKVQYLTNMNTNYNQPAILWDMDGVLVDTGEFHYQAWDETTRILGIPYSYQIFHTTFGMTNATILRMLLGDDLDPERIEEISLLKETIFRKTVHGKAQALPGVAEWLTWFSSQGIPQAVASSAPMENIDFLVDELGLRSFFQALVSAYHLPGKPDPAVFLEAARQVDRPVNRCLVIEDSLAGVTAALHGGFACLAVATTHPAENLTGADRVLNRLSDAHPGDILAWYQL